MDFFSAEVTILVSTSQFNPLIESLMTDIASDLFLLDIDSKQSVNILSVRNDHKPSPRYAHGFAAGNGTIYVHGGIGGSSGTN